MRALRSRSVRILVKGYDTSLHVDVVKSQLTKHFSSCGEVVFVSIPYFAIDGAPNRSGYIYILGDGAEEKALQLSGSEMEGRKIVATSTHEEFLKLTPEMTARLAEAERAYDGKMIIVRGYDTSLPAADIKTFLTNRFSSCGEIVDFQLFPVEHHPSQDHQAIISILGEGAEEKALELNGSDMGGGFKLVVVPALKPVGNSPIPVDDAFPRGFMIPARVANPKKTSRYKMKKKKANRKKAWK
ncbi:nucleolin 1-like [Raphanus sativus]|uniref:Nucleolin 1-like n=1 Tax=Raphanus sativus TaxID=3726 RepID=A0A6J0MQE7_RAPSA|nr:nucleolin 1-like [Raphanus sativus]